MRLIVLLIFLSFSHISVSQKVNNCFDQADTSYKPKESSNFTAHFTKFHKGIKAIEADTLTGYHKMWDSTGRLIMEGKVIGESRQGIWKYWEYNLGRPILRSVNFYFKDTLRTSKDFDYYTSGKIFRESAKCFQVSPSYKNRLITTYRLDKRFDESGRKRKETYSVNDKVVYQKIWDAGGKLIPQKINPLTSPQKIDPTDIMIDEGVKIKN